MTQSGTWRRVQTERVEFRIWHDGSGAPMVLLHGFPETAMAWRLVAPTLARTFAVYAPDIPGYGRTSILDPGTYDYSKRSMASDLHDLLHQLNLLPVHLVGHDRGARIAYRFALDHPDDVRSLTVLATIPTLDVAEAMDFSLATGMYHWSFLAQPYPLPETLLSEQASFFVPYTMRSWSGTDVTFDDIAMTEYVESFANPEVVHAACEDYRAGAGIDVRHDRGDRANGRKITCPTLAVWGDKTLRYVPSVIRAWECWSEQVQGIELPSGHFVMEEQPTATAEAIEQFCVSAG